MVYAMIYQINNMHYDLLYTVSTIYYNIKSHKIYRYKMVIFIYRCTIM